VPTTFRAEISLLGMRDAYKDENFFRKLEYRKVFHPRSVRAVQVTGKAARRKGGGPPPHVMVYFTMALALFAGEDSRKPGPG
jgi:hypothetical protein